MNTNSLIIYILLFFQEEKQLLELCHNKYAPVSEFTALLDKGGVRLNIHNEVYRMIEHSTTNSVIVVYSSKVAMAGYPMPFHYRWAGIHSCGSATMEGVISLTSSFDTELKWTWLQM